VIAGSDCRRLPLSLRTVLLAVDTARSAPGRANLTTRGACFFASAPPIFPASPAATTRSLPFVRGFFLPEAAASAASVLESESVTVTVLAG
jgi:hypothetical protein